MEKDYCIYCWPTKRTSHFSLHFDYYNDKFFGSVFRPLGSILLRFNSRARDIIWGRFLELLSLSGQIKFVGEIDESKMHDRNSMFFNEARKRGLDIEVVWIKKRKAYGNDFRFTYKGKRYYYESIPLTMYASPQDLDDKIKMKKLLAKANVPIAEGRSFLSAARGLKYGEKLGHPLVVKPNGGSLSMHVTVDIKNNQQLQEAIRVAKIYQPSFIVEKFIPGDLYRATVIAKKEVFVCRREGANVTGDGVNTIEELIRMKNQSGNRTGELRPDGTMAFEIDIKEIFEKDLQAKNLRLDSIPAPGEKIYLTKKFTPQSGNDIVIFTENTHPQNKQLFLKVAQLLDADILGIDVICEDISKPFSEQQFAIIETNSVPYTNVHQYPSEGKSEPIAQIVWGIVLDRLNKNS